jgi:peptide methionine sulfoxide reductase msrA/msrB
MNDRVVKSEEEWLKILGPERFKVLRKKATECAFTGRYWDHHGTGVFACAGCGLETFRSSDKFDSGTGWPSFRTPLREGRVIEVPDYDLGMKRTEVLCARCGGHLGHVFDDGPQPTGLRYCINSAALDFKEATTPARADPRALRQATFGAGCFWCTEAAFEAIPGVVDVKVGYMGGHATDPSYKQVCAGDTGHAEVAQVTYDPQRVSYDRLLDVFWKVHDPTSLNRQGADVGPQYRSVIFVHSDEQKRQAEQSREVQQRALGKTVVTEIVGASRFYEADEAHQDYYRNHSEAPYCRMVIAPKLKKLGELTNGAAKW